jgi:uncharacterized protein YkwD
MQLLLQSTIYFGICMTICGYSAVAEASSAQQFSETRKAKRILELQQKEPSVQVHVQKTPTVPVEKIELSTIERQVLSGINRIRAANNVPQLHNNTALRAAAEQQLRTGRKEYSNEQLSKDIQVYFSFPAHTSETNDCNCKGTTSVYRQLRLPLTAFSQGVRSITNEKNIVSNDVQYIGVRVLNNELNILLAGQEIVPIHIANNASIQRSRQAVIDLMNNERKTYGLTMLHINEHLQTSAQAYAERMWNERFYGHTAPDGGDLEERIEATGFFEVDLDNCNCNRIDFAIGENIAKGQTTPAEVVKDWMNSPGHRKNILSKEFTSIGIGYYGNRWVQHFGTKIKR